MSRYSPGVLPAYSGGNAGQIIANALQQKQQTDRQSDIDALTYGIGATPYNPSDSENAPGLSFGDRIKQGLSRATGHGDPYATRNADFNMANHRPTVGITDNGQGGGVSPVPVTPSSDNPGAFSALTGGFTPAGVPAKLRLPSGKIVDTMMTPFGRQMMQAQATHDFQERLLQEKGNQTMQQIGAKGQQQEQLATVRGGIQTNIAGMRNTQSDINNRRTVGASIGNNMRTNATSARNHDTPTGTAIYGVQNRPVGGGSGGGGSNQGSQTSVEDMQQRYNEIAGHAEDLAAGVWQITPSMQAREGLTYGIARDNAAGKTPWRKQMEASGMDLLGMSSGPDFARYQSLMNSTRALGDDAAKVFKGRQNEESVLREVALAQLTPDDYGNPQVVHQKLSRLKNIIDLARHVYSYQSPGGAPGTAQEATSHTSLTPAQQARAQSDPEYAAFLRSKGVR